MNPVKTPWLKHYGEIPAQLDYPDCTMFEYVEQSAAATPDNVAIDFMGTKITYAEFVARVHNCARAQGGRS